jgi:hypothetical protein
MERSRKLTWGERALAAALLALALGVASLESRSTVAAATREGRPWSCWLALDAPGVALPHLFLAYYVPRRRSLDLVYVPQTTKLPDGTTLARAYASAKRDGASDDDAAKAMADAAQPLVEATPHFLRAAMTGSDEPPVMARRWLSARARGGAFWRSLFSGKYGRGLERFELFRIGLEIHELDDDHLRAAYLPGAEDIPSYFARLRGDSAPDEPRETWEQHDITVEVLNATPKSGVANRITKVLRSRGGDVMSTGNAASPQARTVVYDRIGRPELAARVRRMLGCASAEAVTQIDAKRLVDVSVVLADDCL